MKLKKHAEASFNPREKQRLETFSGIHKLLKYLYLHKSFCLFLGSLIPRLFMPPCVLLCFGRDVTYSRNEEHYGGLIREFK